MQSDVIIPYPRDKTKKRRPLLTVHANQKVAVTNVVREIRINKFDQCNSGNANANWSKVLPLPTSVMTRGCRTTADTNVMTRLS